MIKSLVRFNRIYFLIGLVFSTWQAFSQTSYTLSGRVTDAQTGDPVPFAAVAIKGKSVGVSTNFEGFYTLKTTQIGDSLLASSMSYRVRVKAIRKDSLVQTIDFQLESSELKLQEVKIYAGENPAYDILRQVVKEKPLHNPTRLNAYEYESYNKIKGKLKLDVFKKGLVSNRSTGFSQ